MSAAKRWYCSRHLCWNITGWRRCWCKHPRAHKIDPSVQRVVKFWPHNPPERGDILLVDGVRHRVTRANVIYEGNQWTIRKLFGKPVAE